MSVALSAIPPFTVAPRRQIYLGMDPNDRFRRCWAGPMDSVGLIGPPRFGKSSGVVIPTLLTWDGPLVAISSRADLFNATRHWRDRLARRRGGEVHLYDPFGVVSNETSVRWSPLAGCDDPSVCWTRALDMTKMVPRVAGSGGGVFRSYTAAILRALFHAAALSGGGLDDLTRWLDTQDFRTPVTVLDTSASPARGWADVLRNLEGPLDQFQRQVLAAVRTCIDATAHVNVRASTRDSNLDIHRLLRTNSTLFVVVPTWTKVVASLMLGLIGAVTSSASGLAAQSPGGRLEPPLLLALDDMVELAPDPAMTSRLREGGNMGVLTLWTAQSTAQLRDEFGGDAQQALLAATTVKMIFGGASHSGDLNDVAAWAGRLNRREPFLPPEAVQMLPPFHAWLFNPGSEPLLVDTRPAELIEPYRQLMVASQPDRVGAP
jgi:type IV secretion system protein VirD4